jgi:2-desacetyl-2-hydroxyethyl bacteriochlorophyllide A dehydrogenase
MKAAVLYGPFDLKIEEVDKPEPGIGEVLLKVKASGIRGTDVSIYAGKQKMNYPRIIGHEFAGEIEKVGKKVTKVKVGDRVVSDAVYSCGKCYLCYMGRRNLCINGGLYGREKDGSYAEYIIVPESACFKIPDNISFENATIIEMLATIYRGQKRVRINPGESVLILGQGAVGLLQTQLAKVAGATPVIVSDIFQWKLDLAKKFGADYLIDAKKEDVLEKTMEITDGHGVDVVIEAAGSPHTVKLCLDAVRPGGRILLFGITTKPIENFNIAPFYFKEVEVVGSRALIGDEFEPLIKLVSKGAINLDPLIMDTYTIDQLKEALDLHYKNPTSFKVLVFP